MLFGHIKYEVFDRVAWIKFNRPEQLNAMNRQMMDEIIESLKLINAAQDSEIAVAVFTGEGRAFMAGADIKEYAQQTMEEFEAFQLTGRTLYAAIEKNTKPIIAAINGYAFGGGFEIALACDMILCRQYVKMGLPEINLNLIPGGGGTQRLTRKIGSNLANELIMMGRTVTAEEMWARGVVNHIYEKDGFSEDVEKFVAELANRPVDRLRAIKKLTQRCLGGISLAALDMENEQLGKFYMSEEGQEKIQEFYQKSIKNK